MLAGVLELQLLANMATLSNDLKRAEQQVQASTDKMGRSVATLESAFGKLGSTLALGAAFEGVRRLSDDFVKLTAQVRIATHSQAEYAAGLAEVRRISTESQASITATGALYTRLTNSLGAYGATQKQVANITETVSLGLKAYGATSVEASSAMLQLSQAFASNRLGGDEFRAMMESMPNMMRTLATSMGVPFEALKNLSAEGKITAKEMMKAWDDPALIATLQKQANMTRTITGEITVLRNNIMMLVGELMQTSNGTQGITAVLHAMSDVVLDLAKHIKELADYVTIMAALFAGKFAKSIYDNKILMRDLAEGSAMQAAGEAARAKVAIAASEQIAAAKQLEIYASREAFIATQAAAEKTLSIFAISTEARVAAETRLAGLTATVTEAQVAAIATERELGIARAASTAAAEARAAAEIGALAKVGNFVKGMVGGTMGLIGLALFAGYEIADYMGLIDRIFMGAEERIKKLRAEIVAAREIPSQVKTPLPGIAAGFDAVPGIAADAVATYMKVVGPVSKEFSSFIKDGSFMFSKDFMSKEQEKAEKIKGLYTTLMSEIDKLWGNNSLSKETRDKAELQLYATYAEKVAELNKKEKAIHESKMAMMAIELDAKLSADGKSLSEEEKVNKAWAEIDFKKLSAIEKRNELDAHYSALAKARRVDEITAAVEEQKAIEKKAEVMRQINAHGISQIDTLDKEIAAQKLHNDSIGMSAEQIAKLKTEAEALLIVKMENEAADLSSAATSDAVAATKLANIQAEIAKMKELRDLKAGAAPLEAAKKLADEERKANEKLWHDIDHFAHTAFDNIFDKGKNVFEELGKVIKKSILDMLYQMTIKQWIIQIEATVTGGIEGTASGMGGTTSGMGGMGNTSSLFSAGSSLFGNSGTAAASSAGWTTAAGQAVGGYGAGVLAQGGGLTAEAAANTAAMAGEAGAFSGAMTAISNAVPYIGAAITAYSVGKSLGVFGPSMSTYAQATGYRETGSFGPSGVSGSLYVSAQNGGEKYQDYSGSLQSYGGTEAQKTFEKIRASVAKSATLLGVQDAAAKLAEVSVPFDVSMGLTNTAGLAAALQQAAVDATGTLAKQLIPNLEDYAQANETLTQTFVRLVEEQRIVDGGIKAFGMTLGITGLAAADARSQLVLAAGGLTNLTSKMDFFYQNFFTNSERRATQMAALSDTFAQLGIGSIPQTNNQFKQLIQAQDLTTAAGRGMFAALLDLAPAFDQVTKLTDSLNGSLQSFSTNYFASKLEYDRLIGRIKGGSVAAPASNDELVVELKAMRAELTSLRTSSEATASSTRKTTDLLRNVTRDGNSLLTTPV